MDDKEDAKTRYGYFDGYGDHVQLTTLRMQKATLRKELRKELDNSTNYCVQTLIHINITTNKQNSFQVIWSNTSVVF